MVTLFCHGDLPFLMFDPSRETFLEQCSGTFLKFQKNTANPLLQFLRGKKAGSNKMFTLSLNATMWGDRNYCPLHGRGFGQCKVQSSSQDFAIASRSFQLVILLQFESHQFKRFKCILMSSWVLSCSFESWWPLWISQSSAQKPASE